MSAPAPNWERGRNASFRSWKRQEESAPRASRGGGALPTPGSVFWPPDWERIISVVFSPFVVLSFVMVASGPWSRTCPQVDPSLHSLLLTLVHSHHLSLASALPFLPFLLPQCSLSHRPLRHTQIPSSSRKPSMTV